jgi:hypothetical protein
MREEKLVTELATEWGIQDLKTDTLASYFYVDSVNFTPKAALLEQFPNKQWDKETQLLTADSTAGIWFTGRFLPSQKYPEGFIFDTNIASVYKEFYGRRPGYAANDKSSFSVLSYTPSDENDKKNYFPAFNVAIPKLRRGQWYRIVFTSVYGYGIQGLSAALQDEQANYNAYIDYMYSSMYYGSYGGYGDYYGGYMDPYYGGYGGNYFGSSISTTEEEDGAIVTEVQPYTPLVFEIYIETEDED